MDSAWELLGLECMDMPLNSDRTNHFSIKKLSKNGSEGQVLKLFEFDEEGCLNLNEETLQHVFDPIKQYPVYLVSVAGDFRGGKSFLLNLIKRYIEKEGNSHWHKDESTKLTGFESKKSDSTVTTGIDIWSCPFIIQRHGAQDVAILLMDTQGTNDLNIAKSQFCRIFSLSTLLSNVQVFNMRCTIGLDKLEQLQFFIEFGKCRKPAAENRDIAWKKIILLIRDYQGLESFGQAGGDKYWSKLKQAPNSQILQDLDTTFQDLFMKLQCFLMPSPGENVVGRHGFSEFVSDISPDFLEMVDQLLKILLDVDPAVCLNASDWITICKSLADSFNDPNLPVAYTAAEDCAHRLYTQSKEKVQAHWHTKMAEYKKELEENGPVSDLAMEIFCEKLVNECIEKFREPRPGFENETIKDKIAQELKLVLQGESSQCHAQNRRELKLVEDHNKMTSDYLNKEYENKMKAFCEKLRTEDELKSQIERWRNEAIAEYKQNGKFVGLAKEEELQCTLEVCLESFVEKQRKWNRNVTGASIGFSVAAGAVLCVATAPLFIVEIPVAVAAAILGSTGFAGATSTFGLVRYILSNQLHRMFKPKDL